MTRLSFKRVFLLKKMKLKIAIQKSGRLNADSLQLLKDCGIAIDNGKDQLKATAANFPLEVLYLRNGDIPQYLRDGVVDIAIIGENLITEKGHDLPVLKPLGFSKCRVSIAVPNNSAFNSIQDLEGKKIATSYPNTIATYLEAQGVNTELHIINGSVEIAPNIGLADAICDIVSSGSTLFKNNLKEVVKIMDSQAVLVQAPSLSEAKTAVLKRLLFRFNAVLRAKESRYILLNAPIDKMDAITEILPVLKSPTILPLSQEGWCSLHSVIDAHRFWEIIDALKAAGAEDILVCPIEKMVR